MLSGDEKSDCTILLSRHNEISLNFYKLVFKLLHDFFNMNVQFRHCSIGRWTSSKATTDGIVQV